MIYNLKDLEDHKKYGWHTLTDLRIISLHISTQRKSKELDLFIDQLLQYQVNHTFRYCGCFTSKHFGLSSLPNQFLYYV